MWGINRYTEHRSSGSFCTAILFACLLVIPTNAAAHGGVSLEDDLCIMKIGTMRAHFTGYQPKVRASQEFCEDIPEIGEAIIVLDFLNPALRKMDIGFRVLKDETGKGAKTTFNDIESLLENAASLMIEKKAATYPSGSFNVSLTLQEAGWYVGVLSAVNPETNEEIVSVFPFSVGQKNYLSLALWGIAIVAIALSFYFLSVSLNRREHRDVQ